MTREEAIEVIEQDIPCEHDTDLIEALEMAIKALEQEPFDIETYCKEHFCVMVDKDVWDKVTNRLVKSKAKCKDCIYLSSEKNTVGRLCINPSKIFRTKTSCWKHTTTPACKLFKAR